MITIGLFIAGVAFLTHVVFVGHVETRPEPSKDEINARWEHFEVKHETN